MNAPNGDTGKDYSADSLGSEPACAPGCNCKSGQSGSRPRMIAGVVVLAVAAALVARAVISDNKEGQPPTVAVFAPVSAPIASRSQTALQGPPETDAAAPVAAAIAGDEISSLSELNRVAAQSDGVFVYLPDQQAAATESAPNGPLTEAVRTLSAQGISVRVFTLKPGGPEYTQLAAQMTVPGVVALVKGRGMAPVTGAITEAKLIQGFVAASGAGACGPSAESGCCP